jgi:hypothetical protein
MRKMTGGRRTGKKGNVNNQSINNMLNDEESIFTAKGVNQTSAGEYPSHPRLSSTTNDVSGCHCSD